MKKIILVLAFLLIEIFFTFFIYKTKFKFRGWKKMLDEIFVIALVSIIIYYLHDISAVIGYLFYRFIVIGTFLL